MSKHTDFSRIFIDRPILATVLSALILVAGLMAIPSLPVTEYPDVVPPSVQVTANYPGANPRTIAETVAGPIEEAVNGVENMIYMKSTASSDGQMVLTVTFKSGTDIDLAAMQVQNRVSQAVPRLPEAVRTLGVTTVKASPTLTMVVHLDSPNKTYDALYLSNFANLRVRDELARLPGVGQAQAFGAGNYAMRIWIDPAKAAARGQRHRRLDPRAERRGLGRKHRQPADAGRHGDADLGQCAGAAELARGLRRNRAEGRR
jgi:multidrug efflux pump